MIQYGQKSGQDLFAVTDQRIYTVSELTGELRVLLEERFNAVRVVGEMSGPSMPASGHMYFSLKDAYASLPAVMFRSAVARMSGPAPEEGTEVECLGRLTVYEPRGRAQLVVEWMVPKGAGALGMKFLALKAKLQAEGLFDPKKKLSLPLLPGKIGVVTSPSGAAIQDILKVLDQRFPSVPVLIYPVRVQGEGAAEEIARAVNYLGDGSRVDVLIVGRGGGSIEDLWAFNEELVVRAVAASKVPVISAVGHEVDLVLTDLAADVRAPTPTAAAEMVVPSRQVLARQLADRSGSLRRIMNLKIAMVRNRMSVAVGRMRDPRLVMAAHRMRLDEAGRDMETAVSRRLKKDRQRMAEARVRLAAQDPRSALHMTRSELLHARSRLVRATRYRLEQRGILLDAKQAALRRLSPLEVLARGYSIVSKLDGSVVRSYSQVGQGDAIQVRLQQGFIDGTVDRARSSSVLREGLEEES